MPTNDFLAFATGASANVETQSAYAANANLTIGNQPGVADAAFVNKTLRQAAWIASVLAQFIANTSGSDVLDDGNQANLLAAMALTWPSGNMPTQTKLTTTGTTAGYLFTVTSANATVGAVYANNGNNFTVLATLSAGTLLFCSGTGTLSGSTLTKQSGTGDATITFSVATPMATYTPPANVKYLKIKMIGGGGGASSYDGGGSGSTGGITTFGSNLLLAFGGGGGPYSSSTGGSGGAATVNSPAIGMGWVGGQGTGGAGNATSDMPGPAGASSPFGGGGGGAFDLTGGNAAANSGAGGGGAVGNVGGPAGTSGGSGGYIEAMITSSIASSYYYIVGSGGTGATGGNGGINGGNGGSGIIIIEEHYNS